MVSTADMLTLSFLLFNQASDNYFVKYLISKYLYSSLLGNVQCSNENKHFVIVRRCHRYRGDVFICFPNYRWSQQTDFFVEKKFKVGNDVAV